MSEEAKADVQPGTDKVPVDDLREMAVQILIGVGVPAGAARLQAGHLLEAEMRGHPSHGLLRLPRIVARIRKGVADPIATGTHTWRGPSFLAVDGQQGLGPVVAHHAFEAAMPRARQTGVSLVAIASANHLGMLADYVERIATQGLVCVALTTSEPLVHPYGGRRPLIGTNPIGVGVPAEPRPFVLDMATSEVSMGRIHAHCHTGTPLRPGWAVDRAGEPTLDPFAARDGALSPFGGAKGYGLGLALELLVAAVTGTATGAAVQGTLDDDRPATKGDLFLLISPETAGASLRDYLDQIRSSGYNRAVLVPGDRARIYRDRAERDGIALPTSVIATLHSLLAER